MKNFLRGLLHVGAGAAVSNAVIHLSNGAPITSGNVLIPVGAAFAAAVLHAALPGIMDVDNRYYGGK